MKSVSVKNLGKKYRHRVGGGNFMTLRDQWSGWRQQSTVEEFWALQEINFQLEQGQVLAVVGRNGAGKSTLFKILSRITPPTIGEISLRGQVSSMLEVGTGFHPELSGRENIYLNGAILGMSRAQVQAQFEAIVDFAQVSEFLEDPVKYYSSGMYLRLAFGVAAFLTSQILIVDEVLAVGDTAFQKKCLAKIQELVKDEGRTVLLVSHDLTSVEQLADCCLWLEQGQQKMLGPVKQVLAAYRRSLQ